MENQASKHIKAINKEAVHQICSGQVVLNLATAVKELVENSLDAGATVIDVRLREYGSELIEVTDNGCGVEATNFQGLTMKHHTSKLQDFGDLVSVETFGFRGEALSSLCALSRLTVTTRHLSADCASRIVFDHSGLIVASSPAARQVGTTVSMERLFCTLPVRQKEFHRNLKREFGKMCQLLYAYCLVSTGVKICCTNQTTKGGRTTVVATQGCQTVRENIACVFGTKQLASLLDVVAVRPTGQLLEPLGLADNQLSEAEFELYGLVSTCAHGQARGSADRQFYYVNSRPCEPTKVMKAVNEVFHQYNAQQQPFVFLDVCSARDSVDVNVTPDKRQVFLEHEKLLVATIKASLQALYENIPSTYTMNNVHSPPVHGVLSPSPASLSPAARLSQWRHQVATKRPVSDSPPEKLPKQAKLDSMFTKTEKATAFMNSLARNSNSASILNSQSHDVSISSLVNNKEEVSGKERTVGEGKDNVSEKSHVVRVDSNILDSEFSKISEVGCSKTDIISGLDCQVFGKSDELSQKSDTSQSSSLSVSIKSTSQSVCDDLTLQTPSDSDYSSQSSSVGGFVTSKSVEDFTKPIGEESSDLQITDSSTNELSSVVMVCDEDNDKSDTRLDCSVSVQYDTASTSSDKARRGVEVSVTMDSLRECVARSREECEAKDEARVRFRTVIDPSKNQQAEQELSREISKDMFAKMEVVGQFNLGFIIARLHSDLFIVDQHATDEKYNFETLQRTTTISSQKLVVPQQLELTAVNEAVLMDNISVFKANGYEFLIDENAQTTSKVKLTSIPMSHNWTFGKEDIDELLFMLQDAPQSMCRPSRVRAMFASRACRKSVMIGSALSTAEMKRLLTHMGEIEQPWNCPHGRPTMRHLINLDFI